MWLCKRPATKLAALGMCLFLGACFKPMYGELPGAQLNPDTPGEATTLQSALAQIEIDVVEGRVPQRIRNELLYAFNTTGAASSTYRLNFSVDKSTEGIIVQPNREAEAQILRLTINFTLTDLATDKSVFGGKTVVRASYDRSRQIFANERAELDAENRAARVAANNIRTRIASFIATKG